MLSYLQFHSWKQEEIIRGPTRCIQRVEDHSSQVFSIQKSLLLLTNDTNFKETCCMQYASLRTQWYVPYEKPKLPKSPKLSLSVFVDDFVKYFHVFIFATCGGWPECSKASNEFSQWLNWESHKSLCSPDGIGNEGCFKNFMHSQCSFHTSEAKCNANTLYLQISY